MVAYDNNNIFAKILRGELPCMKVYENDHVLAFLDIMPRSPGHTLVIPKAAARNIFDILPEDYAHVIRAAHKLAAATRNAFNADGMTVATAVQPRYISGRTRMASMAILTSFASIFLPTYSGVRPTMRPATKMAMTTKSSMP